MTPQAPRTTATSDDMTDPLEEFFDYICAEFPRDELISIIKQDGDIELTMFIIDVEMDPVRITFELEPAAANIHADGHTYHMISVDDLHLIAETAERAAGIYEGWFETDPYGKDGDATPSEKHYRKWLALADSGADLRVKTAGDVKVEVQPCNP